MNKIKILTILADLNKCNGISSYVMNYYINLDKSKFQMDFIITGTDNCEEYINIIQKSGGNIYYITSPKLKTALKDIKKIKEFIKLNKDNYDIVHSHLINVGYFYLKYAKRYGIKVRVLHCHNSVTKNDNMVKEIRNKLFNFLAVKSANKYFACSKLAGNYLFGNREFFVVNNGIDIQKFIYNQEIRNNYRKDMNLENKLVVGFVGRIAYQKNPSFLIDVFNEIHKENKESILIIIGDGNLEEEIKNKVKNLGLEEDVLFLGTRNDISSLMQAMDMFLLPSFFEGLPVTLIEAQAAGLTCYVSDTISKESKVIDSTTFIELDLNNWKSIILDTYKNFERKDRSKDLINNNFDIVTEAKKLEQLYIKILK
jgi:glycosyltransferase involved in cell wall biosynthesis